MRHALAIALAMIGCGDELTGDDGVPPKPSCDRADVMALMTCPDGHGWIAQWSRPDAAGTTRDYFAVEDDPGEPWTLEGEVCVEDGDKDQIDGSPDGSVYWQCQGEVCSGYRHRVEDGDAVVTNSVSCNPDQGAVTLTRTTVRPGEEPLAERFGWFDGAEQGIRRGDPAPQP